jgi:hypothetical protein
MVRDNCEKKRIIVTLKPVEVEVPEEWTDDEISAHLEDQNPGLWTSWVYEDSWR